MTLPTTGFVYVDANSMIYTVEKHPDYGPLLRPMWLAAQAKQLEVISSELTLLECFVGPMKRNDSALLKDYESALLGTEVRLLPITQSGLREGARLRATTNLKTPDAIHAATALQIGCALFVTNDRRFLSVAGLSVVVLDDLRTP
jgi:predicted nucleic acid-binding protein